MGFLKLKSAASEHGKKIIVYEHFGILQSIHELVFENME